MNTIVLASPSIAHPHGYLKEQVMRAIRFETFGDPSVLELAEVPAPSVDEKTAVVRVMAASINPSDVKNVAGAMKQTTLAAHPRPRFRRSGRGRSGRMDRSRGLGHGRRCWLYPRRNPCRADRRAGGEPAPQARNPQLRRGGVGRRQLHGRLAAASKRRPEGRRDRALDRRRGRRRQRRRPDRSTPWRPRDRRRQDARRPRTRRFAPSRRR